MDPLLTGRRLMFRLPCIVLTIALLAAACGGESDDGRDGGAAALAASGQISIVDAWARPAITGDHDAEHNETPTDHAEHEMSGATSAVYMTIRNDGETPDRLVAVRTSVARVVEVHETTITDGLMRMRPVAGVDVPGRGEVVLEPGGLHAMLMDITRSLEPGDTIDLTLVFDSGVEILIDAVEVRLQ